MNTKVRNFFAWAYSWLLYIKGAIARIHKQSEHGVLVHSVYFHNPSKRLFEKCVKWFLKRGYRFLSTDELYVLLTSGSPFPPKCVIFSIDDGWKENYTNVVPVAEKYQIPITIFITTQPVITGEYYWWSAVEKSIDSSKYKSMKLFYSLKALPDSERRLKVDEICAGLKQERQAMTSEEIKQIATSPYVRIGGHTLTHPILTRCSEEKLKEEIEISTEHLKSWSNLEVVDFAYPNGSYDQIVVEKIKTAGYRMAFTTKPDFIRNDKIPDLYAIPRFDVLESVSYRENVCRMTGVWFLRKPKDKVNAWE